MIRRIALAALALAALVLSTFNADAQRRDRVAVGTLECRSPGALSLVVSVIDYDCYFHSRTGRTYRYHGRTFRVGFEAGITAHHVLVWAVYAPTRQVDRSALRGTYAGGHAGVGLVVGVGGNVLVGGSNNTISLQPISVEGTIGVNFALSVAGLTLR